MWYCGGDNFMNIYMIRHCIDHQMVVLPIGNEHHANIEDILISNIVSGSIFIKICFMLEITSNNHFQLA